MKKNNNINLILFILIIPMFLIFVFYISPRLENNLPKYSVINKSKMGFSVFYESLKKLNYPVEKTLKQVDQVKTNNIQIISSGGGFDINSQEVKKWVEKGGILVYLTSEASKGIDFGTSVAGKENIKLFTYHKGSIINAKADILANKKLLNDTNMAYELLREISNLSYDKIYFNESYLFPTANKTSLWDAVPTEMKYICYQMLLALGALFYFKGKRFGKTIPLHEEVERSENEYLHSAASLYRQAKCLDLMVDNYYKKFLKGFGGKEDHWLDYWEIEKIPSLNQARSVYEFMKDKKIKHKEKEYIKVITTIEYLNKILDKRRDSHWKTLKKTLQRNS